MLIFLNTGISISVFYFCTAKINKTQQLMISNTKGRRKGKKRQNDQSCNMLVRVKLEDEGISRHGRNTRKLIRLTDITSNAITSMQAHNKQIDKSH